jgi:hypothetical protein
MGRSSFLGRSLVVLVSPMRLRAGEIRWRSFRRRMGRTNYEWTTCSFLRFTSSHEVDHGASSRDQPQWVGQGHHGLKTSRLVITGEASSVATRGGVIVDSRRGGRIHRAPVLVSREIVTLGVPARTVGWIVSAIHMVVARTAASRMKIPGNMSDVGQMT